MLELLDVDENEKRWVLESKGKRGRIRNGISILIVDFVKSGKEVVELNWKADYESVTKCRRAIASVVSKYAKDHGTAVSVVTRGERLFLIRRIKE